MVNRNIPRKPTIVHGVGINDSTWRTYRDGEREGAYYVWVSMLNRCYSKKIHEMQPTYIDCTVCDDWLYYTKFYEWFMEHIPSSEDTWELDKDLLVMGNKIYSPTTCVFVPKSINSLFTDRGRDRGKYMIGVSLDKRSKNKPYRSTVSINGKQKQLGTFETEIEAHECYLVAKHRHIVDVCIEYKTRYSDNTQLNKLLDVLINRYGDK